MLESKRKMLRVAVCAVLASVSLLAQAPPASMLPKQPPPGWVDGSKNPELIPDVVAYRLVFANLAIPPASNSKALARQANRLAKIGLEGQDLSAAQQILTQFTFAYQQWALNWNQPGALQQAEALIQKTRGAFSAQLSPRGTAKLDQFIQKAKVHMAFRP